MTYKAIFIDMDGVLVLTEKKHYLAWKKVLEKIPLALGSFEEEDVVGIADEKIAREIIKEKGLSSSVQELCNMKKNFFLNEMLASLSAPEGRDEFLAKAKEKHQLAVVSSSSREEITKILTAEKILKYFDFFIGAEDTNRHKPYPDPYLLALGKAKLTKNDVFAIEDSPAGIKAALNADIKVFGIASYMHNFSDDLTVKFFQDFNDLSSFLFK